MALAPDVDDVQLMQMAAEQNPEAIGLLYDRHSTLLFSVLMHQLADPNEAKDILHDVFVKLHSKATQYRAAFGRPVAWLLTMARNAATDRQRRQSTHRRYVVKAEQEQPGFAPAFSGLHQDEVEVLNRCVGTLPEEQCSLLKLAYFGGFTQQEISDQLEQPLGTVKARIRRGLLKLRECVEGKL